MYMYYDTWMLGAVSRTRRHERNSCRLERTVVSLTGMVVDAADAQLPVRISSVGSLVRGRRGVCAQSSLENLMSVEQCGAYFASVTSLHHTAFMGVALSTNLDLNIVHVVKIRRLAV